jgi:hypothetical protein
LKQIILLLLVFSVAGFSSAQDMNPDFTGSWTGTATWGVRHFKMEMEFTQEGKKITGIATTTNKNNDKFIKYKFMGEINNGIALVRGTEIIDRKGVNHCMPGLALTISDTDPNQLLGKWKSNKGKQSCLIPGTGGLSLTRDIPISNEASRIVAIAEDDNRGKALSNQLQTQKYHGLFIAVQDYDDESVIDLSQPTADAKALMSELRSEYNFAEEDMILLTNPTRSTIIETFDLLTQKVKENDNFLIFYAGHGIWDEDIEQGYWLPSDAKKSSKAAWLSNGTIRDYIRAIDSKHTLLITDACFSGGILRTREAFTASRAMLEMYNLPSRKAMTSGALKTVPDKSVFIEYLIKALKANDQPLISADQLFSNFKYNVINNSPNGQVPQYGVISQADDEGGEFIFLKQ